MRAIRSPTHSGWKTRQAAGAAAPRRSGAMTAGAETIVASEPGPQPGRPDRRATPSIRRTGRHGRAEGRHEDQAHQADAAVDQDDRRRQRLGPGRAGGVPDADHVTADVARQEVVEERRDQVGGEQGPRGARHLLRVEQQPPAPGCDDHRRGRAPARSATHGEPTRCGTGLPGPASRCEKTAAPAGRG